MPSLSPSCLVRFPIRIVFFIFALAATVVCATADDSISYNRDVRPLLSKQCFACHGPDDEQRQADLRFDRLDDAIDLGLIVPGDADQSEVARRIMSTDPAEQMPPPDSRFRLDDGEVELLRRWIEFGAEHQGHWAFIKPVRPDVPKVDRNDWAENAIDRFVLAALKQNGQEPEPQADRYALIRRVYLDLIGLPPTPEEADAFVHDVDPKAYEHVVDTLLASPRYGEHWARMWLDLARYSDTNGYEKDRPRSIWPYRDWVIRALNDDMPFDQFTIEQLAGDMLPDATVDQRVATGFHRNTMLNEEGGIDPLEYRFYAMVDRVATTGTVWLGLSTGCAQCHSHKYDPISHQEYYSLMALLNNADEPALSLPIPDVVAKRQQIQDEIHSLIDDLPDQFLPGPKQEPIQTFQAALAQWIADQQAEVVDWQSLRPVAMKTNLPHLELLEDDSIFSTGDVTKRDVYQLTFRLAEISSPITALRLEVLPDDRLPGGGPGRAYYEGGQGDFFLSEFRASLDGEPLELVEPSHSYGKNGLGSGDAKAANVLDGDGSTGWSTSGGEGKSHHLVLNLEQPIADGGELQIELLFERHYAASLGRFRISYAAARQHLQANSLPPAVERILVRDPDEWSDAEGTAVQRHFAMVSPELAEARKRLESLQARMPSLPTTLVMQERPADNPRPTHRHHRGEYLSPRELVKPGLPAIFQTGDDGPANRLEFARWLASQQNPLVARVTVNRAWRAFFGSGLVKTNGDFGTQSAPPSHPALLDWLACEFVARGWSLKQLHRQIVTSAAYRQSSSCSSAKRAADPENRLISRGPRFRLDAEVVRDSMLKAAGTLSSKMYGPSVYPPQPASVTQLAYGATKWTASPGEDRFRRSLYTYQKRTAPFAAYTTFDAPTRENCTARRDRSNTPLQALTLLNDGMFVELARTLAAKTLDEASSPASCAEAVFRRVLTRPPEPEELQALLDFHAAQHERIERGELNANAILGKADDETSSPEASDAERAAWTLVARAVMNLDEAITKP